jgi:hypothetical protein
LRQAPGANPLQEEVAMKFYKISLFLSLLMAVCVPAVAQTEMRFSIPFNFSAAGKSLPAGHYTVVRVCGDNHAAWRIYSGRASVMVLTNSVESQQRAHRHSLLFSHAGGVYSLIQFWPTQHIGRDLPSPKAKQVLIAETDEDVEIGAE